MKAEQMENLRYAQDDYCEVNLEEKIMFSFLKKYSEQRKQTSKNIHILDIGCGSGNIGKRMLDIGYRVSGIDFSEEAVRKANERGIQAKKANLDESIPERNESFDIVWAGDIIEHVFDPMGLLKEVNRVLKKDGALILSIPSDVGIVSRIKMLLGQSYQEQMYRRSGFYKHHTFFNLSLITFMLESAQFKIVMKEKVLIAPNKKRFRMSLFPSAFYNELVILAQKTI